MKKRWVSVFAAAAVFLAALPLPVCQAEELKVYKIDFDDFTQEECASPGAVMQAIKDKTGITATYAVRNGQQIRTTGDGATGEDRAAVHKDGDISKGKVLDGENNNVAVVDGRLELKRDFVYQMNGRFDDRYFGLLLGEANKITSGGVRIHFDIEFPEYTRGYNTAFLKFGSDFSNSLFDLNFHDKRLYLAGKNETAWNAASGLLLGEFTGKHTLDLTLDLDYNTVHVNIDGESLGKRETKPRNGFATFYLIHKVDSTTLTNLDIALDNIRIEQVERPELTDCNIVDQSVGVPLTTPAFSFNLPMTKAALGSVSLYEGDTEVTDAEFVFSENNTKLTLATPLTYSTPYTIKFGEEFYCGNGLSIPAQDFRFHTMHRPPALTYQNDLLIADADGGTQPITALTGGMTAKASASFSNNAANGSESGLLILALYSAEETMECIQMTPFTVPKGGTAKAEVQLTLPEDVAGKQLRAYAWSGYGTVEIIMPSQSVGGAAAES